MFMIQDTFIHFYDRDTFIHFSAFIGFIRYLHYYLLQGMLCVAYLETEFGHVPLLVQF